MRQRDMASRAPQLNIRSSFARKRATELAATMGVTTTEVVEEALRAFRPPLRDTSGGTRRGGWLRTLSNGGHPITIEDVAGVIEAIRNGERD